MRTKKPSEKEATQIRYDQEAEPIVLGKPLLDLLLDQKHPADLIALYAFYYYTAKWQRTIQIKATVGFTAKGLNWGTDKTRARKKDLIGLGLIEDVMVRNKTNSQIAAHYLKINFMWNKESSKATLRVFQRVGNTEANAKSTNIKRYPSTFVKYSKSFHERQQRNWPNLIKSIPKEKILQGAETIRKLVELDEFDFNTVIKPALEYAIDDDFWSRQILSLASLRSKSASNGNTKFVNLLTSMPDDSHIKSKKRPAGLRLIKGVNIGFQQQCQK